MTTLGLVDKDVATLAGDLQKSADTEDLKLMLTASDSLAKAIDAATPSVNDLAAFPHTRDIANGYRTAFPLIHDGAKEIHDSLAAGNSAGVAPGFAKLHDGLAAYGQLRGSLSDLVEEALTQQRLYLK
ncbi:MAG TPA: hypothetical protein VGC90_00615 [Candidatus Limnocylindrales bacterium]